jgi:hypothetical protein
MGISTTRVVVFLMIAVLVLTAGTTLAILQFSSAESVTVLQRTAEPTDCTIPAEVQDISLSATKYPNIRAHMLRAIDDGWPRIQLLTRSGADARRDRLLRDFPLVINYDRDEYPMAFGRAGWLADVEYVPASENRSHGAVMGAKLRRFCSGTRFRYVFY